MSLVLRSINALRAGLLVAIAVLAMAWAVPAQAGPSASAAPERLDTSVALEAPPLPPLNWRTQHSTYAQIHAEDRDDRAATRLARHAAEAVPRIATQLGVPIGDQLHIYLTPTDAEFRSLQPGAPPSWADGTAWPHRGLIYLRAHRARPGTARPLEQVLDHEIVHVLLGRAFGEQRPPRWLQEGMAQVLAGEYGPHTKDNLAMGVLGDSLIPLSGLTGRFPADPVRAQLAYAESADFVAWLSGNHGPEALTTVVREMSQGSTAGLALEAATGMSIDELDEEWRGELDTSMLWLKPLVSDTVLLGGSGLAFIGLGFVALRKRKRKLARWAQEEALQDAVAEMAAREWPHPVPTPVGYTPHQVH